MLTYSVEQLPAFDTAFYNGARAELSKVAELRVPPRGAKAFKVPAGHLFRIVSVEGPQVGDLNLWSAHDLTERFYSGKTRVLHATHLSTGDRFWSTFPSLRPRATITHDTPDWYGWDQDGAKVHDVVGFCPRRDVPSARHVIASTSSPCLRAGKRAQAATAGPIARTRTGGRGQ